MVHHHKYPAEQRTVQVYNERPPEISGFERGLDVVKNIMVILTCLAVLITLGYAYLAVQEMVEGLRELTPFTPLGE